MRRVTIRDVARTAGVSLGTVSRVLNRNRSVSESIRERVLQTINALGYQPDAVAQSMRTQATRTIGIIVPDVSNPLFSNVVSAAEAVLTEAGYSTLLANNHDSVDREIELVNMFRRRRTDGLLTSVSHEGEPRLTDAYRSAGIPVTAIERELAVATDSVGADHAGGIEQAVRYLIMLGHRRIGMITVPTAGRPGRERVRGFRATLAAAGISPDPALIVAEGYSAEYGFSSAHGMLSLAAAPTAILAGGNQMSGVLKAARMLGRRVPDDLSLIILGDSDLASLVVPPLTAVRWDIQEVGRSAARLMLSRLQVGHDEPPRRVVMPTELILRQSCAPLGGKPQGRKRKVRQLGD